MSKYQFIPGAVVRLKGQKNLLTVLSISDDIANVVWQTNGINTKASYQQDLLEVVPRSIDLAELNRLARIRENKNKRNLRGF